MKKRLIYQYWDGPISVGCRAGIENMQQYANIIGVDYRFDDNPKYFRKQLGEKQSQYFGCFRPVFDPAIYEEYDQVLFADTDVFAIAGLLDSIFDAYPTQDLGICTEPMQPKLRQNTAGKITSAKDEKWAKAVASSWPLKKPIARDKDGLLKVYNTGVVLYSNNGLRKCREQFVPFKEYTAKMKSFKQDNFYTVIDQPYLHAMLFVMSDLNWIEMDNGWNSYVHYCRYKEGNQVIKKVNDTRDDNTNFVHVQLAGADNYDSATLSRIVNLSQEYWNLPSK
jgi:hypothetical protein